MHAYVRVPRKHLPLDPRTLLGLGNLPQALEQVLADALVAILGENKKIFEMQRWRSPPGRVRVEVQRETNRLRRLVTRDLCNEHVGKVVLEQRRFERLWGGLDLLEGLLVDGQLPNKV